jgi:hypothetical protein
VPLPNCPLVLLEVAPELDDELLDTDEVLALAVSRASAGSWPVTSMTVISSQVAMNSATAPAITLRRIMRTRAWRACRIAIACACVMDVIVLPPRSSGVCDQ